MYARGMCVSKMKIKLIQHACVLSLELLNINDSLAEVVA